MSEISPPVSVESVELMNGSGIEFSFLGQTISFNKGSFTAILGQNGSGKTTLLEAVLGIRPEYTVRRSVLGSDILDLPINIKQRIGISTQVHSFAEGVKVRDVVKLHSGIYRKSQNDDLLAMFDLTKVMNSAYARTSGGQKKRLSLYFALAHDPDVAFLDEPEAGLDVQGLDALLEMVDGRSKANKTTIAATHHDMATDKANDVVFLNSGELAYTGQKSGFVIHFLGEKVLEVDVSELDIEQIEYLSGLGRAQCSSGVGTDKLLLFGNDTNFEKFGTDSTLEIEQRSILRKVRSSDIMAWINARTTTQCSP